MNEFKSILTSTAVLLNFFRINAQMLTLTKQKKAQGTKLLWQV
jgi:hypothetical protein